MLARGFHGYSSLEGRETWRFRDIIGVEWVMEGEYLHERELKDQKKYALPHVPRCLKENAQRRRFSMPSWTL